MSRNQSALSDHAIQSALQPYGVAVSPQIARLIRAYTELLLRWNTRISLTSIKDTDEILKFHFGESLFALSAVPINHGRLADVGTGAGFPGLALKVARPDIFVSLVESNTKKCAFLEEVIRALALENINVVRGRFEALEWNRPPVDVVTSRALGQFPELLLFASSILVGTGRLVLWLGQDDAESISARIGFQWQPPVLIPQSRKRFLLVGRRTP